jgi:hypothetical protein
MTAIANQNIPVNYFSVLMEDLKAKCIEKIYDPSAAIETQWALLAVGISLFVLAGCFIGAAFAMSSLFLGKVGISLFTVSVLPLGAIPLIAPTDYEDVADRIDRELITFADREKIELTPDNALMYIDVKNLIQKREAEEDQVEIEAAELPLDPEVL